MGPLRGQGHDGHYLEEFDISPSLIASGQRRAERSLVHPFDARNAEPVVNHFSFGLTMTNAARPPGALHIRLFCAFSA